MSKDPSFPFYAQDFLVGVMHLDMEERGIYITLLAYQWSHMRIPKKRLGLIVGMPADSLPESVMNKFNEDAEFIWNERLEHERKRRAEFKEKQRKNGLKGGRPKKPKESQKKPLEHEHEKEHENKKENKRGSTEGEIVYPFDTDEFMKMWENWKKYKKDEFKFRYASKSSEQGALTILSKLANSSDEAVEIIMQSIGNGWQGFFPLKNRTNARPNESTFERIVREQVAKGNF